MGRARGRRLDSLKDGGYEEKAETKEQSKAGAEQQANEDECKGNCDNCDKLTGEVDRLMKKIQKRYDEMKADRFGMKQGAEPSGRGDWKGHVGAFNDLKTPLRKAINRAKRNGCSVPDGAEDWLDQEAPSRGEDAIS